MGGVKKKTLSSTKNTGQQSGDGANKPKKDETKSFVKTQRHKSSVIIEDINDLNIIKGMKAITAQSISKSLGVKISIANNYIRNLESKGSVKLIGGYSGHRVYSVTTT